MDRLSFDLSILIAMVIGIAVSLDVAGLLISQHLRFRGKGFFWRMLGDSALHAFTHAFLFLLYFWIVNISIEVPPDLIELIKRLDVFPEVEKGEVLKTTFFLSAIVIVIFTWITYAKKIIDDYSELAAKQSAFSVARIDLREGLQNHPAGTGSAALKS